MCIREYMYVCAYEGECVYVSYECVCVCVKMCMCSLV